MNHQTTGRLTLLKALSGDCSLTVLTLVLSSQETSGRAYKTGHGEMVLNDWMAREGERGGWEGQ
jgi:hypothetical protein